VRKYVLLLCITLYTLYCRGRRVTETDLQPQTYLKLHTGNFLHAGGTAPRFTVEIQVQPAVDHLVEEVAIYHIRLDESMPRNRITTFTFNMPPVNKVSQS